MRDDGVWIEAADYRILGLMQDRLLHTYFFLSAWGGQKKGPLRAIGGVEATTVVQHADRQKKGAGTWLTHAFFHGLRERACQYDICVLTDSR